MSDAREDLRDVLCFSSARWGTFHERPQHLMARAARDRRVIYVEDPALSDGPAHLSMRRTPECVMVVTPTLPSDTPPGRRTDLVRTLVDQLVLQHRLSDYVLWTDTPQTLAYVNGLDPAAIVYDCVDDCTAGPGGELLAPFEELLMAAADVVFTAGPTLQASLGARHDNCHLFPSVVDVGHFLHARRLSTRERPPADQGAIPGPRVGFAGEIDHRVDFDLLTRLADLRPDLRFVMIGPVARAALPSLPRRPNLSWLGVKSYTELPYYLAGWCAAVLPYHRNAGTHHFAPARIPEHLAAGRAVISTSLPDVVQTFGAMGLVRFADSPEAFSSAIDFARAEPARDRNRRADRWLAQVSWDKTWSAMDTLVADALAARNRAPARAKALRDFVAA